MTTTTDPYRDVTGTEPPHVTATRARALHEAADYAATRVAKAAARRTRQLAIEAAQPADPYGLGLGAPR